MYSGKKILNSILVQVIHTNYKIAFGIVLATFVLLCPTIRAEENAVADEIDIRTEEFQPPIETKFQQLEKEADNLFYKGIESKKISEKEAYLNQALDKYMLLLNIDMYNANIAAQIGIIHDTLGHSKQAKEYLFRAVNLENLNPFANFCFAEYYFNKKDYSEALRYYLTAFSNGYANYYQLNMRLGTIYEKLGDIPKARHYYILAKKQNPRTAGLSKKIISLGKIYYSKPDFKP